MNRIKRVVTWVILLSIFLFFIFRSDLINAQSSSGVKVPNVIGMTEAEAREAIEAAGLSFGGATVGPNRASKPSDSGRVQSSQYSKIGEGLADGYAKPGTPVTVQLWGPYCVKVPNVFLKTEAEAREAIEAAGLSFGGATVGPNRAPKPSDSGKVIHTYYSVKGCPDGYAVHGSGMSVELYKPYGVKVPILNGMTEADAKSAIEAAGLSFGGSKVGPQWARMPLNAGKVYKLGYSASDIVSESSEGTYVRPGAAITIYLLAAGVKVPDLYGMTEAEAKSAILAAGLSLGGAKVGPRRAEKLSDAGRVYMSGHANSDILSESSEGIFLKYGAAITIYLLAAPGVKVPNVLGMTEAEAKAAIEAAGLSFGGARVSPNRAPKPSDSGRVQSSQYSRIREGLADGYAKPGTPVIVELWGPYIDKDRCSQIEATLIAASQAKDINRFRTLVEQARLENCNFYQSAYNHLRNWEQQLQSSSIQPQPQPPQQVSPIQRAWQGSWTLVSKHTGGKFRGASVRSQLTVSFQNNQAKVTFGKYTAIVKSITPETLVYEVTSGGNKITTTLHRVNRGIKGNFQGVHVATGETVMGEFRSDPPP